jgi:RNA polymerase sigma-70 factor (sigma-E family)
MTAVVQSPVPAQPAQPAEWAPFVFDESAMTAVVQGEWMSLIRLATLLLSDRSAAEDVVQEVCEAVWRRRPELASRQHLVNYLRTAVVNRARSAGRKRRTVDQHRRQMRIEDAPPADVEILAAASHVQLLDALAQLSVRQRTVLVLRYWSQLSEAEIADTLGVRPGTVKSTAHQAISALQRSLKGTT